MDLFIKRVICISTGVKISKYIQADYKNWDNYNLNNVIEPNNKNKYNKDDKNKNKRS